jgi:hypothetical protein
MTIIKRSPLRRQASIQHHTKQKPTRQASRRGVDSRAEDFRDRLKWETFCSDEARNVSAACSISIKGKTASQGQKDAAHPPVSAEVASPLSGRRKRERGSGSFRPGPTYALYLHAGNWPPLPGGQPTLHGTIHGFGGLFFFITAPVGIFVVSRHLGRMRFGVTLAGLIIGL